MQIMQRNRFLGLLIGCLASAWACGAQPSKMEETVSSWWPEQKPAKAYVTAEWPSGLEEKVILQAVAGLKARAVNEGAGDELVWIEQKGKPSDEWKTRTVARLKMQDHGVRSTDELLTELITKRQLLGYVLYTAAGSRFMRGRNSKHSKVRVAWGCPA